MESDSFAHGPENFRSPTRSAASDRLKKAGLKSRGLCVEQACQQPTLNGKIRCNACRVIHCIRRTTERISSGQQATSAIFPWTREDFVREHPLYQPHRKEQSLDHIVPLRAGLYRDGTGRFREDVQALAEILDLPNIREITKGANNQKGSPKGDDPILIARAAKLRSKGITGKELVRELRLYFDTVLKPNRGKPIERKTQQILFEGTGNV